MKTPKESTAGPRQAFGPAGHPPGRHPRLVTLEEIRAARERIRGVAIRTPLLPVKSSERAEVYVKCENLQKTGSFKIRGAYNKIASLEGPRGVVAHSSGNHAQAVALAAKLLGVRATVVMLDSSVPHKVEGTRAYGAEVVFGGPTSEAIRKRAEDIARERGWELVRPFDDPRIVEGTGTIGLEILEEMPGVRAVLVPVGGGGLVSGIATALKETDPSILVVGVEPEGAPKMYRSRKRGRLVRLREARTVADGLKPVRGGELTFAHIQRYVDDLVLVSDEEIMETACFLLEKEKLVVEPSGAAALAAVRHRKVELPAGPAVAVLSGGNADIRRILDWAAGHEAGKP
ncbi:MAG: hypothetical protein KatS3mg076_0881 [Candidatus Binatia bacterium]|nr:MAG: hypothetical protein KatS3mg076_0881 [Candidatus Binatia bacterium]